MKATGIIRRIDDLGRIVIPREIRRRFHIKEGDALELYLNDGCEGVIFIPYRSNLSLSSALHKIIEDFDDDSDESINLAIQELKKIQKNLEKEVDK